MSIRNFLTLLLFSFFLYGFSFAKVYAVDQPIDISLDSETARNKIYKNMTSLSDIFLQFDNKTGKQLQEMKISETGLFDIMQWEPYSALKKWKFSSPDGQKPVYAQFKTADGQIIGSAATFVYDITPPEINFMLDTKSIGPNTLNIITDISGQDKWSVTDFDYRIDTDESFSKRSWWNPHSSNKIKLPVENFSSYKNGETKIVYFQAKDPVGNTSQVLSASYIVDKTPPIIYVTIDPSDSLFQNVQILAYDEFSDLGKMQISNDPRLIDGVKEIPYQQNVPWSFDERRVVWVKIWDSVGNASEPYPAYFAPLTSPTSWPSWTPAPSKQYPTPTVNPTVAADPKYIEFQNKIAALEKGQQTLEEKTQTAQENIHNQEKRISFVENLLTSVITFLKSIFSFWK